jgi:hypothetical protein
MARLYVFAEGQTEQTFASEILKPHLARFEVYLYIILVANSRRGRKTFRGGGRNYSAMKADICRLMAQEKGEDVFFTTMIDLYAIASDFPGLTEADKFHHIPEKRVKFLEQSFTKDISDPRFIPYIQLHEYEAYLFSDPTKFRIFYNNHEREINELDKIASSKQSPEMIDDGPATAPSKRIIALFPDYEDAKTIVGPLVAESIGLDIIRQKCFHFNEWVSCLERLAKKMD